VADVVPPQSAPLPPAPNTQVNQTAVAQNPPAEIAKLPVGTTLAAQVGSLTPQSNLLQVQTSLGNLLLQSPIHLSPEDQIQLILQKKVPQLQFLIKAGNQAGTNVSSLPNAGQGQAIPPQTSATPSKPSAQIHSSVSNSSTATQQSGPTALTEGQVKLDIGITVRATVLNAPEAARAKSQSGGAAAPSSTQAGTQPSTGLIQSIRSGLVERFAQNQMADTTSQLGQAGEPLKAGSTLELKILEILAKQGPTGQTSGPIVLRPGQTFQGTVNAQLPSGHPVVDSPIGKLVLETAAQLESGSRLSLEIVSLPQQKASPAVLGATPDTVALSRELPALKDTLDYLEKLPTEVKSDAPAPPIPRAGGQLTSTLLFFLSALKGGGTNAWLSEQTQSLLSNERPDLMARLNDEFSQVARPFNEGTSGDWRTALIPFLSGMNLENFQLSLRGGKESNEDGEEEEDARFIIDVTLSQLGRVQLDGLVKSEKNQFDLYVRSDSSFPHVMRKDISQIFMDFTEVSGVSGNLVFQAGNQFVEIPVALQSGAGDGSYLMV